MNKMSGIYRGVKWSITTREMAEINDLFCLDFTRLIMTSVDKMLQAGSLNKGDFVIQADLNIVESSADNIKYVIEISKEDQLSDE